MGTSLMPVAALVYSPHHDERETITYALESDGIMVFPVASVDELLDLASKSYAFRVAIVEKSFVQEVAKHLPVLDQVSRALPLLQIGTAGGDSKHPAIAAIMSQPVDTERIKSILRELAAGASRVRYRE